MNRAERRHFNRQADKHSTAIGMNREYRRLEDALMALANDPAAEPTKLQEVALQYFGMTMRPTCVCGEINTRHCPIHGQGI